MKLRVEKASADYVDVMFLYERYVQGDCWTTPELVNSELNKVNGKTAKRNTLKDQITI